MRLIVLDTETTGLEPSQGHRVIEIGAVEIFKRRVTGRHLHFYINPERDIDAGALAVHGISNDFLKDKPLFQSIVNEFLDFIRGAELIIHNAAFDVGFLNHEFRLAEIAHSIADICEVTDTLMMARQMHPGQKNSLDALCKRYSVDNSNRTLHGALLDANILARVYLAMTGGQSSMLETFEVEATNKVDEIIISPEASIAFGAKLNELPIIKAHEHELIEHEKFLQLLDKKAGKSVWADFHLPTEVIE